MDWVRWVPFLADRRAAWSGDQRRAGGHWTGPPEGGQGLGIDVADAKLVVVKTASNFQFFARWRKHLMRVDTPGMTQSDLSVFRWQRLPRPIDPFDDMADWRPDPQIVAPLRRRLGP